MRLLLFTLFSLLSQSGYSQHTGATTPVDSLIIVLLSLFSLAAAGLYFLSQAKNKKLIARTDGLINAQHRINKELANKSHLASEALEQQRLCESNLEAIKSQTTATFNALPSAVFVVNNKGAIQSLNRKAELIFKVSKYKALNKSLFILLPCFKPIENIIRYEQTNYGKTQLEFTYKRHIFSANIIPLKDIPDTWLIYVCEKHVESHSYSDNLHDSAMGESQCSHNAIQHEKLASLGEMAAGLAHEINNPLSAILNNLQNIHRRTSPALEANRIAAEETGLDLETLRHYLTSREVDHFFENAKEATKQAMVIVANVLNFAHSGKNTKGPENVNTLIDTILDIEHRSRHAVSSHESNPFDHKIKRSLRAKRDICLCSPPEIQQVILNLIKNSIQACEGINKSADILVSTDNTHTHFVIKIKDNGPGVEKEKLTNIFKPFYTTKRIGEGTGLGLSISYLIITDHHNGDISAYNNTGDGMTITIQLPLMSE
ncbi:PAS domain-containing sensor histidine kinase [Sessilibacter corallicola]|uniref:PAS domain-containing sensor histidine kinase n=1 Tax=Sessilibacter corallicola TaxID=2904075 RepID=UPI001E344302|nr:ATP-binding protein [Sessilibacter corallicola]MCE2030063.1 ATP-binding protein [Sessilibacter corallicola]